MAICRPPMKCPHCGLENHFKYNRRTLAQKISGFVGDNGGSYPTKCKGCKKPFYELKPLKLTKAQKDFLKTLEKISNHE